MSESDELVGSSVSSSSNKKGGFAGPRRGTGTGSQEVVSGKRPEKARATVAVVTKKDAKKDAKDGAEAKKKAAKKPEKSKKQKRDEEEDEEEEEKEQEEEEKVKRKVAKKKKAKKDEKEDEEQEDKEDEESEKKTKKSKKTAAPAKTTKKPAAAAAAPKKTQKKDEEEEEEGGEEEEEEEEGGADEDSDEKPKKGAKTEKAKKEKEKETGKAKKKKESKASPQKKKKESKAKASPQKKSPQKKKKESEEKKRVAKDKEEEDEEEGGEAPPPKVVVKKPGMDKGSRVKKAPSSRKSRRRDEDEEGEGDEASSPATDSRTNRSLARRRRDPILAHKELIEKASQFVSFSGFDWDEADVEFNRGILQRFQLADLEDASDARVKVVIVKDKKRTIKVLQVSVTGYRFAFAGLKIEQAIARGLCIVDEQWLHDSVEAEKLLKPEDKMVDYFPGAVRSRQINLDKDPRVFEEKLVFVPPRTKLDRSKIEWLVLECGGKLVRAAEESDYKGASEKWILDAIEQYQIPPKIY